MRTFKIKTSEGKNYKGQFANITSAQDSTLNILKNDGDFLEIMGSDLIHRTTKQSGYNHPRNNGFKFEAYNAYEGIKKGVSLFKK